jgi:hypothetical protein
MVRSVQAGGHAAAKKFPEDRSAITPGKIRNPPAIEASKE